MNIPQTGMALVALLWLASPAALSAQSFGRVSKVPVQNGLQEGQWKQGKASSRACIDASHIGGAIVVSQNVVDLMMRGGKRWRFMLDRECPQMSFYGGFYVQPGADGELCAGKDRIMLREGGSCRITRIAPLHKSNSRR